MPSSSSRSIAFNRTSVDRAHVVLPAAMHHERPGTTTNIEGRVLQGRTEVDPAVACAGRTG